MMRRGGWGKRGRGGRQFMRKRKMEDGGGKKSGKKRKTVDEDEIDLEMVSPFEFVCSSKCNKNKDKVCFPVSKYKKVVGDMKRDNKKRIKEIPKDVLKAFQVVKERYFNDDESTKESSFLIDFSMIPVDLMNKLFAFQLESVSFAIKRGGRCLFGDEMGLGKTFQAIASAFYFHDDWPVLVICPLSAREMWRSEFLKYIPNDLKRNGSGYEPIKVVASANDFDFNHDFTRHAVVITTYSLVKKIIPFDSKKQKANLPFGIVIADESHYLKNINAQRTQSIVPIISNTKRAFLLTGTPALSRPQELYPQLMALNSEIFPSFFDFGQRYCAAFQGPFGWDFSGHSHLEELNAYLTSSIMIRRLKKDIMGEIVTEAPVKSRKVISLDKKISSSTIDELKDFEKKERKKQAADDGGRVVLMKMWEKWGIAKTRAVASHVLSTIIPEKSKAIVFAHHKEVMDLLEREIYRGLKNDCEKCDDPIQDFDDPFSSRSPDGFYNSPPQVFREDSVLRIDGSTSAEDRANAIASFQAEPSSSNSPRKRNDVQRPRVILVGMTAGGTGVNLFSARHVFFAELHWTPGLHLQAEDRAHRIGTTGEVQVHYLVAGPIDSQIWKIIHSKLNVVNDTLDRSTEVSRLDGSTLRRKAVIKLNSHQTVEEAPPNGASLHNTPIKRNSKAPLKQNSHPDQRVETPSKKRYPSLLHYFKRAEPNQPPQTALTEEAIPPPLPQPPQKRALNAQESPRGIHSKPKKIMPLHEEEVGLPHSRLLESDTEVINITSSDSQSSDSDSESDSSCESQECSSQSSDSDDAFF